MLKNVHLVAESVTVKCQKLVQTCNISHEAHISEFKS